jgi:hypothetical protein
LVSALSVASSYADCVVLSTYESRIAEELRTEMVSDSKVWKFFEDRGCKEMLEILDRWQKEN